MSDLFLKFYVFTGGQWAECLRQDRKVRSEKLATAFLVLVFVDKKKGQDKCLCMGFYKEAKSACIFLTLCIHIHVTTDLNITEIFWERLMNEPHFHSPWSSILLHMVQDMNNKVGEYSCSKGKGWYFNTILLQVSVILFIPCMVEFKECRHRYSPSFVVILQGICFSVETFWGNFWLVSNISYVTLNVTILFTFSKRLVRQPISVPWGSEGRGGYCELNRAWKFACNKTKWNETFKNTCPNDSRVDLPQAVVHPSHMYYQNSQLQHNLDSFLHFHVAGAWCLVHQLFI